MFAAGPPPAEPALEARARRPGPAEGRPGEAYGSNHQRLRGGAHRARRHRQEARGRRPAARGVAEAVRARRAAFALLPRPSRRGRAAHRDSERARRGQAGAARLRRRRLMAIADYIRERRAEVDAALATVLPRPPECPAAVADAMQYSLTAGGKRLRPILCLASADAVGGRSAEALPAACAIELIHTYSLIHDDLPAMDDDTMRRGRPTLHVVAGEGMAILAGHGLLTEAFGLLARQPRSVDPVASARKQSVVEVIATEAGPIRLVGGQAIDLACVTPGADGGPAPPLDAEALKTMHGKKAGALFRGSAVAGAIMGGGTDEQIAAIDEAAAEFGLAFQIVDDILDVEGASADLGKTAGKDAAAGKPTYPALYGLDRSRAMAAECLERAEATLRQAGLADAMLLGIGRWIVERSN